MLERKFTFRNNRFALLNNDNRYTIMIWCEGAYTQLCAGTYKTADEAINAAKNCFKYMCMGFIPMPSLS